MTFPVTTPCDYRPMTRFPESILDGYAECAVCRTDTLLLCSPCGDPVCANCRCPNGCEEAVESPAVYFGVHTRNVEAAA